MRRSVRELDFGHIQAYLRTPMKRLVILNLKHRIFFKARFLHQTKPLMGQRMLPLLKLWFSSGDIWVSLPPYMTMCSLNKDLDTHRIHFLGQL